MTSGGRTEAGVLRCTWRAHPLPFLLPPCMQGFTYVVGVDEAGRGPLAGPVVAAACVLPPGAEEKLREVADSKQLDEASRERLYAAITSLPGVAWAA